MNSFLALFLLCLSLQRLTTMDCLTQLPCPFGVWWFNDRQSEGEGDQRGSGISSSDPSLLGCGFGGSCMVLDLWP
jgi:hypothetical protein